MVKDPRVWQAYGAIASLIFLDLKLHDIPHTVERAAIQIGRLGVQLTTVHAAGGSAMIEAAKRGLIEGAKQAGVKPAKLLAITQLTSTSQAVLNDELGIEGTVMASVKHLASLAETSGADGVVASALEAPAISEEVADDFLIVTPGIRPQIVRWATRFALPRQTRPNLWGARQSSWAGPLPKRRMHQRLINNLQQWR